MVMTLCHCLPCMYIKRAKMGLKTHDCHILLQTILAAGLRGQVPKDIYEAIAQLGRFFKILCSKTINTKVLDKIELEIPEILCKLEYIFPLLSLM